MFLDGFVAGPEREMDWIRVDLELVDAHPTGGVTTLRYRVKRLTPPVTASG